MEASRGNDPHLHASASTSYVSRVWECRQTFSLAPSHSVQLMEVDEDNNDFIEGLAVELLKLTWNIWIASPLFGFQYNNDVILKSYGKRLREDIANSLSREDVSYNAKFTVVENLSPTFMDPPAINVTVYSKKEGNGDADAIEKCVYKGFLISWRASRGGSNDEKGVRLPLLLCRGLLTVTRAVHKILGRMFDCTIMTFPISEDDLMWLIPIALNVYSKEQTRKKEEIVELEYVLPQLPPKNHITVKFPIKDMLMFWRAACKNDNDGSQSESTVIKLEQVELFHDLIKSHMLEVSGMELGFCMLNKISLPSITLKNNRVKVTSVETMDRMLLFLQEKAVDLVYTGLTGSSNRSSM